MDEFYDDSEAACAQQQLQERQRLEADPRRAARRAGLL